MIVGIATIAAVVGLWIGIITDRWVAEGKLEDATRIELEESGKGPGAEGKFRLCETG